MYDVDTVPFDPFDREYLLQHFEAHGEEFGATTPEEYEAMADQFMSQLPSPELRECVRPRLPRMICRYNMRTGEYGVIREGGWLVTYFKPSVREHGFSSNFEYFKHRCK
jgi:pyocin large subunit-like protein